MTTSEYLKGCPLCRTRAERLTRCEGRDFLREYEIECPACGRFSITVHAIDELAETAKPIHRVLSGWVRERLLRGEPPPCICSTAYREEGLPHRYRIPIIVETLAPKGLEETIDRSLLNLAVLSGDAGRPVTIDENSLAVFFAQDSARMGFYIREMANAGWLSQVENTTPGRLTIGLEGWKYITELRRRQETRPAAAAGHLLPPYEPEDQTWFGAMPELLDEPEVSAARREIDVLLVVAVPVELNAVLRSLGPPSSAKNVLKVHRRADTYFLGHLGAHDVAVTMCEMGTSGRAGSILATSRAVEAWHPKAVMMPGIAFGAHPERQHPGDVLVGAQVVCYELQRVGPKETVFRGPIVEPGLTLLNRFRNAVSWEFTLPDGCRSRLQPGAFLSGEKLIDNPEFKAKMLSDFPEAIGGDMEAAGIYAAAESARVEWIVAKAICDWADGEKRTQHQALAAAASVSLVAHVLSSPDALSGLTSPGRVAELSAASFAVRQERESRGEPEVYGEHLEEIAGLAETLANECGHVVDPQRLGHSFIGLFEHCMDGDRLRETIRTALPVDQAGPLAGSLSQVRGFLKGGHGRDEFREMIEPLRTIARALRARRR